MRANWDPELYARFSDARARPARELMARIPPLEPRTIVDLGCGDGPVTALLAERWPAAEIVGIDSSPAMLERARSVCPSVRFFEADIANWRPEMPVDLIYSNAALHWLDRHMKLLPDLLRNVAPGGVLAVQMPANFEAPSHRLLAELAAEPRWRDRIGHLVRTSPVGTLANYIDWLGPEAGSIDAWETTDWLMLEGPDAVLHWMKGTALRPFLTALGGSEGAAFESALAPRLAAAYPRRPDGRTLFPFARRYFVAIRRHNAGA
jgi:trans-aconitate 2-methyltransferase